MDRNSSNSYIYLVSNNPADIAMLKSILHRIEQAKPGELIPLTNHEWSVYTSIIKIPV